MIDLPNLPPLQFHHIGLACTNLDAETRKLASLGYYIEADDFTDPIQGIHGRFLVGQVPRLELLVPIDKAESCLTPWLKSGTKMYHLAYETDAVEDAIEQLSTQRAKVVVHPVPAVAFDNRKIAFVMLPNMLLIELISTI